MGNPLESEESNLKSLELQKMKYSVMSGSQNEYVSYLSEMNMGFDFDFKHGSCEGGCFHYGNMINDIKSRFRSELISFLVLIKRSTDHEPNNQPFLD